jgi:type I restriction enzyme R subunit
MKTEMLVCSLVHKFGRKSDEGDFESYIEELK